jgi:GDP-L-fucose synthase
VDDLADACSLLMEQDSPPDWMNIGSGSEVTIKALVELVAEVVGYRGQILWDTTKPDGTPRKLMDSSKLAALGWRPSYDLKTGVRHAYECFLAEVGAQTLREG